MGTDGRKKGVSRSDASMVYGHREQHRAWNIDCGDRKISTAIRHTERKALRRVSGTSNGHTELHKACCTEDKAPNHGRSGCMHEHRLIDSGHILEDIFHGSRLHRPEYALYTSSIPACKHGHRVDLLCKARNSDTRIS